jgi:hypothetical protein
MIGYFVVFATGAEGGQSAETRCTKLHILKKVPSLMSVMFSYGFCKLCVMPAFYLKAVAFMCFMQCNGRVAVGNACVNAAVVDKRLRKTTQSFGNLARSPCWRF